MTKKLLLLALLPVLAACSLGGEQGVQATFPSQADALFRAWENGCKQQSEQITTMYGMPALNCSREAWMRSLPGEAPPNAVDILVPQAKAESVGISAIASEPVVDRKASLREYLLNKNSPYADIDIIAHCDAAKLDSHQCRLLLAICFAESDHGTDFTQTVKVKTADGGTRVINVNDERTDAEGKQLHNCSGTKRSSYNNQYPYDPNGTGWWIVKYPDWDTYWSVTTAGMKNSWFDKGGDSATVLCYKYVGNPNVCEQSWVQRVQQAERELSFLLI